MGGWFAEAGSSTEMGETNRTQEYTTFHPTDPHMETCP